MNIQDVDREIKKELRAGMNGILSARMREAGMPFHLIFGVELPRLRSIAEEFPRDADLACRLWEQDIRETRRLAIMLMPPDSFAQETANAWAQTMLTAEEAQVMAMLLLPDTPNAKETSMAWLTRGKTLPATCACLTLRHLIVRGKHISEAEKATIDDLVSSMQANANLHLRKAIQILKDALKAK